MRSLSGQIEGPPVFAVSRTRCEEAHDEADGCSYRVAWRINPHMKPGAADPLRACAQHRTLIAELLHAGATVFELPFIHGAFDSVFAKDNALLLRDRQTPFALLSSFAEPQRQAEQRGRRAALEALGFRVFSSPGTPLEGGDIVKLPGGGALLGHGFRSSVRSRPIVEAFVGSEVLPLQLVDPWLYHLDTALAVLDDGTALCCRDALSPASLKAIERHPQIRELLFVPRDEALRFALNFVQVQSTVITGADAPVTARLLELRGLRVRKVSLSEFQLAGGSAACLVSQLYTEERVARSDTTAMRSTSA